MLLRGTYSTHIRTHPYKLKLLVYEHLGRGAPGSPGWHADLFGPRRRPTVITCLSLLPRRAVRGAMSLGRMGERRVLKEGRDGLGAGPEGRPESRHGYHHASRHHGWDDEREIHPSRAPYDTLTRSEALSKLYFLRFPSSLGLDAIIHNSLARARRS